MGNEFGHPEWIDFPREGNDWTHHYARRQWSLRENPDLKFHQLGDFDQAMLHHLNQADHFQHEIHLCHIHEQDKIIALERGNLLFCFNFHPNQSQPHYPLNVTPGTYTILLNTDDPAYGGHDILQNTNPFKTNQETLTLYIPARTGLILKRTP
jgi:1,4-alpha-glucan branching enzyme